MNERGSKPSSSRVEYVQEGRQEIHGPMRAIIQVNKWCKINITPKHTSKTWLIARPGPCIYLNVSSFCSGTTSASLHLTPLP